MFCSCIDETLESGDNEVKVKDLSVMNAKTNHNNVTNISSQDSTKPTVSVWFSWTESMLFDVLMFKLGALTLFENGSLQFFGLFFFNNGAVAPLLH